MCGLDNRYRSRPMIRPMLAATVKSTAFLPYPLFASPKYDGVRAVVKDGVVYSRNGKPIPNRHTQARFCELDGFDGELIVGPPNAPDTYRRTVSGVMSVDGTPNTHYYIYDEYGSVLPYKDRFKAVIKLRRSCVLPVPQTRVASVKELEEYELWALEAGYEGVMLRDLNSTYKFGRSTLREAKLLKLKRFQDDEATIVAVEPWMENNNPAQRSEIGYAKKTSHKANKVAQEKLGALIVKASQWPDVFGIGTGFDDALRCELWAARTTLLGKVVKFKHFPAGGKSRPRFPVFLGFRPEGA